MSTNLKKLLAAIVLAVLILGGYLSVFGIGSVNSVKDVMKYGLDINGGVYVVMEAQTDLTGDELKTLMEQTRAVLDNRVNQLGVAESSVTIEGENRLRIEMPGVDDAEDAIQAIGKTAQLQFVLSDGTVIVDGSMVKDAGIATDGANYKIYLEFNSQGADLFAEGTRKALSKTTPVLIDGMASNEIAIVLDGMKAQDYIQNNKMMPELGKGVVVVRKHAGGVMDKRFDFLHNCKSDITTHSSGNSPSFYKAFSKFLI